MIEGIALITNTIPGMVLGLAFLFCFSGTSLQSTFLILVLCNMIHYFSTPYLMMKESLAKLNGSWETTAMLMGDNWIKTIIRVVTPNALSTIISVFSYYFINAMVTISVVIFLAGARTMVFAGADNVVISDSSTRKNNITGADSDIISKFVSILHQMIFESIV